MIDLLMTPSVKNWKMFNTLQHSLSLEQQKALLGNVCIKTLVFNLLVTEGCTVFFYKIVKGLAPSYLQSYLILDNERTYNTRLSLGNTIKTFATWTSTFRAIFFPYCTKE